MNETELNRLLVCESHLNTNITEFYKFAPDLCEQLQDINEELLERLDKAKEVINIQE